MLRFSSAWLPSGPKRRAGILANIKLAKSAVNAAKPQAQAIKLHDTLLPGFLCRIQGYCRSAEPMLVSTASPPWEAAILSGHALVVCQFDFVEFMGRLD